MPTKIIREFVWTEKSLDRNRLTLSYEPLQPYIFIELAKAISADTIIDIGANVGFYSVVLGSLSSVENIFSFEPIESAFEELEKNVNLNNLTKKASLFNIALSEIKDTIRMDVFGELSGANSIATTSIHKTKTPVRTIKIKADKLDSLVKLEGAVVAIKVDVEGHELEALRGATELLSTQKGVIQLELYGEEKRKNQIVDWLSDLGWQRLISIGPDAYFTNVKALGEGNSLIAAIERAMAHMLDRRPVNLANAPIRRKIGLGLSIEISGALARKLRKVSKRK